MRVLFACGGTGGHINPAIAVAKMLRERRPDAAIRFAGARHGMEAKLVPAEGFALDMVDIEGFSRKLSLSSIPRNIRAARHAFSSLKWARGIIADFKPDVVVGTGGYASFPVLYSAAKLGIPTIIHESNAYPGLTTRVLASRVSRVLVNFAATREYLKGKCDARVSGMPIRQDIIFGNREEARLALGLDDRPLIVSFWGSQGAREMNRAIAEFISLEAHDDKFFHIHATGAFAKDWLPQLVWQNGVELSKHTNIELREYINDMPKLLAAADLVMCRGGASTISELAACAVPAIIVPSPNVAANHQETNARVLSDAGGAVVILEKDAPGRVLYDTACELLCDAKRLRKMSRALTDIAVLDGTERILNEIRALSK